MQGRSHFDFHRCCKLSWAAHSCEFIGIIVSHAMPKRSSSFALYASSDATPAALVSQHHAVDAENNSIGRRRRRRVDIRSVDGTVRTRSDLANDITIDNAGIVLMCRSAQAWTCCVENLMNRHEYPSVIFHGSQLRSESNRHQPQHNDNAMCAASINRTFWKFTVQTSCIDLDQRTTFKFSTCGKCV
eukprot:SAG11_NODE_4993_length_1699_cov_1.009375_2_plen_187_part_00